MTIGPRTFEPRRFLARAGVITTASVVAMLSFGTTSAHAALPGASSQLTRAPYLTDLTGSSVRVTWATTGQSKGTVRYGPPGDCTASAVTSVTLGNPITVNGVTQYQNSVAVTGLSTGATYCYRVFTGGTSPVDLLGTNPSPQFATLDAADSTAPFSFAVFGDWGDTTNGGVNNGSLNVNQANVVGQIAASGSRFALSTGDIGYPGGTQTNYGDVNQTGVNISGVFGPSYWAVPGQSVPMYAVTGNHGRNANFLTIWPQSAVTASSGGTYAMVSYPSILGTTPASYPTSYYAFSTGGVRFYVLDAAWSDSNVGSATGGPCGSHCAMYEVDRAAHWTASAAQYQWLAQDLAAHPGGLKMAVFHFPLRSDDNKQPDDVYLQNTPGSTGSLEQLLHDAGVNLVFNGHSHTYQRFVSRPGGVPSYVSGGGGAKVGAVAGAGCSPSDAYAIGWSYSKSKGSRCGAATVPTSDSQVYHFLKVTVNGTSVTVTPTDSLGQAFDVQTYNFASDTTAPSAPVGLSFTQPSPTRVTLRWSAATDNIGVSAYDIYRNGLYLVTTTPTTVLYSDATVAAGVGYSYEVRARDHAGNTTGATVHVNGGQADSTPPTTPTGFTAIATGPTTAALSWGASTDNVGLSGYTVLRGGAAVATVGAAVTSYVDPWLVPGTEYTFQVVATDIAGNASPPSNPATVVTPDDTEAPSPPGTPVATTVTPTVVGLSWGASTDNVGVVRYDILRDGSFLATASGTTFTDTTAAPGTTYTYAVRAYDAADNFSTSGTLMVTSLMVGSIFSDGFESGGLGGWNTVSGMTVQGTYAHGGSFAARESSTGTATYAYEYLPGAYSELWAEGWVYVVSRSTSATLFGFRTATGSSIINLYIDSLGRVSLRNNVGFVTTNSTTTVAAGGWHRFVLHAVVNGTSSSVDVSMDGVMVPGLTLTGQNLGTSPITRLQLGETTAGRTYDIVIDDIVVSEGAL